MTRLKAGDGSMMPPQGATTPKTTAWSRLPLLFAALVGFFFALFRFGLPVLSPTNIGWFRGDSTWHFLVWHFFRGEPWRIPPGRVEGFLAPLGTTIGSADALPLLAFPFKIFGASLPSDFQYLGLWLFLAYVLQGVFGYLLARTFCPNRWLALVAGLLFLFSPIMIFRAGHIALSGHWILLFALWHYFATARRTELRPRAYLGLWLFITALVGLIHPYLAAMVLPIAVASLLREVFKKRLKVAPALWLGVGMSGLLALEWWLSGLIGTRQALASWGFDYFSMNLNAVFNPATRSRLLPPLATGAGQYEGFAYLGLGIIALLVLALVSLLQGSAKIAPKSLWALLLRSGHLPLILLSFGFFIFSLGRTVSFGETALFDVPLTSNFTLLTSTFRAPGRFFWPTYYLIYVAVLSYVVWRFPRPLATALLSVGVLVQLADLKINQPFAEGQRTFTENLRDVRWPQLVEPFSTVAVIPAFARTTARCGDYADFAYLAANQGKYLTTGAAARPPAAQAETAKRLETQAIEGPRDQETLYVFSTETFAETYLPKLKPGLRCHRLNVYLACYSAERNLQLGPEVDLKTLKTEMLLPR